MLGHRGARSTKSIPENTLASFDLALEQGCDGFEFDVRLTADGQAVVCHDREVGGLEIAHAKGEHLQQLCRLEQVLLRYQANAFLDIELKVPGLEEFVLRGLRQFSPSRGYVVSSFLPEVLVSLRALDPDVPLGLICETTAQLRRWPELPVQFVLPHQTLIDIDLSHKVRSAGRRLFAWTVNLRERMLELQAMGVDGLISDRTDVLGKLRE